MGLFNSVKTPDNTTYTVSLPYGYCETAAGTVAKTVTVPNVSELTEGLAIIVRFKNSNTASSPTLNVNGLGAKNIYRYGTTKASNSTTVSGWIAGAVQLFVYNGTGWVRDYWSNTTYTNESLGQGYYICDTAANDGAKITNTDTDSKYTLVDNGIVSVKFTNGSTQASTLNINSKGEKPIVGDMTDIQTNEICTFIYDGANYYLVTRSNLKDALLNGAGEAYDTLKELGDLIDENTDAIDALEEVAINKMDKNNPKGTGTFSMNSASATGTGAFAIGNAPTVLASGDYSFASGYGGDPTSKLEASGDYSHAEGYQTTAFGVGSHAEGQFTQASGNYSHAEGRHSQAFGSYSHAEGGGGGPQVGGSTYGAGSHAEGCGTNAIGAGSHAEGYNQGTPNVITLSGAAGTTSYVISNSTRPLDSYVLNGCRYFYKEAPGVPYVTGYNSSTSTVTLSATLDSSNALENVEVKAFYAQSGASGDYAHVEGYGSGAMGNDAHAEGYNTQASGIGSHAEGQYTEATGHYSHAEGGCAGGDSMGGNSSKAAGLNSHAEGSSTYASAEAGHAEGYKTGAYGTAAHAEGYETSTSGQGTHAEGYKTRAYGVAAHAEGGSYYQYETKHGITGYSSSRSIPGIGSMGEAVTAYGPYAYGNNSHAEGGLTYAKAVASHAEGGNTSALGAESHAEGNSTTAAGHQSHAEGFWTIANDTASHAEGCYTMAIGKYSHAEGQKFNYTTPTLGYIQDYQLGDTDDNGHYTLSLMRTSGADLKVGMFISTGHPQPLKEGAVANSPTAYLNDINNFAKIVEINSTETEIKIDRALYIPLPASSGEPSNAPIYPFYGGAYGKASHTSGLNCLALGDYSFATGIGAIAEGKASFAEGGTDNSHNYGGPIASGDYSHAEGYETIASGLYSHAKGRWSVASGDYSHAEGDRAEATGDYSHAEGFCTIAAGKHSYANGRETQALSDYQTVIGKYNIKNASNQYAFIIGNGTFENSLMSRSNAFTVDWSGNGVFSGGVTATSFNGYTIEKSVPSDAKFTDTTYSAATTSAAGLMSADDKTKLNGITAGAQPNFVTGITQAGGGSGGKAAIATSSGTTWYVPTLVAGTGTIATAWLPKATSSAQGIVQVGSNITVSNGTISLTKSNVTNALGYTPSKEFIFDTYSKEVTINPGDQAITIKENFTKHTSEGYTLLGYINQNGGYTDQWLISYGTYGNNIVAMVHSKYSSALTQTISCTAIWYKN